MVKKTFSIIIDRTGKILKNENKSIMIFEYPIQAEKMIEKVGSPYLLIRKYLGSNEG